MQHPQNIVVEAHQCGSRRVPPTTPETTTALHRIAAVIMQENVAFRTLARRLGKTVAIVRKESQPSSDMLLSNLFRWQEALGVPIAELVSESTQALSSPIRLRASLLKLMRTVRSIQEHSEEELVQELAKQLCESLTEMMPELQEVSGWPTVGQRRKSDELGAVFYNIVSAPTIYDPTEET